MKLHIFAIGGTGSRIVKSLTMLLGAGMKIKAEEVICYIIDPDADNEDVKQTNSLLEKYETIHQELQKDAKMDISFFGTKITHSRINFSSINDNTQLFKDFIEFESIETPNKELIELLFSSSDRQTELKEGFHGKPNIGSVVFEQFWERDANESLATFYNDFQNEDRIFIIGSIFGGTGAAGMPSLLKLFGEENEENKLIQYAPKGILNVHPYYDVKKDDQSTTDSSTFFAKTKASLLYQKDKIEPVNSCIYYIGNDKRPVYSNHDGGKDQNNPANFVELAGALAMVNFMAESRLKPPENSVENIAKSPPPETLYKEFGIPTDFETIFEEEKRARTNFIILTDLYDNNDNVQISTRKLIGPPLVKMKLFKQFIDHRLKESLKEQPWARTNKEIKTMLLSNQSTGLYPDFIDFLKEMDSWLIEMSNNDRSFKPFYQNATDLESLIFGFKIGHKYYSEDGFADMDHYLNFISKHDKEASKRNQEIDHFKHFIKWGDFATSEIYDERVKKLLIL